MLLKGSSEGRIKVIDIPLNFCAFWKIGKDPLPPLCQMGTRKSDGTASFCMKPSTYAMKSPMVINIQYFCDDCWPIIEKIKYDERYRLI